MIISVFKKQNIYQCGPCFKVNDLIILASHPVKVKGGNL